MIATSPNPRRLLALLGMAVAATMADLTPSSAEPGSWLEPGTATTVARPTQQSQSPSSLSPPHKPGQRPQPAATPTAKPASAAATPAPRLSPSLPADDYYARRAKEMVQQDEAEAALSFGLDQAYPDHNAVVCEAGCYGRAKALVYFAPRTNTDAVRAGARLVPSSSAIGRVAPAGASATEAERATATDMHVRCIGGCYGSARRVYDHRAHLRSVDERARSEVDRLSGGRGSASQASGARRPDATVPAAIGPRAALGAPSRKLTQSPVRSQSRRAAGSGDRTRSGHRSVADAGGWATLVLRGD